MKYEELVSMLSQARIGKYYRVAKGDKQRTLQNNTYCIKNILFYAVQGVY